MWPNVIGDILADEITAMLDLPLWLRSQTRTQRLIDAILNIPEGAADSAIAVGRVLVVAGTARSRRVPRERIEILRVAVQGVLGSRTTITRGQPDAGRT
jgi:hypothetical protein